MRLDANVMSIKGIGAVVLAAVLATAVLAAVWTCGCQRPALASSDGDGTAAPNVTGAAGSPPTAPGYPIDTRPPKDFFSDQLLRTLGREASATVVCRLQGLTDIFSDRHEPDVFYDAECEIAQVVRGSRGALGASPLHFIWQVERGSRMPPPRSELLVYLKARKEPLENAPPIKWAALDTGVMRYTPALRERIAGMTRKKK
ncbi:MAG TPA: hypothetical protein VFH68_20050 [Polyangia bacterium]|nr:hypothetical protein [Polyangia bacterium]